MNVRDDEAPLRIERAAAPREGFADYEYDILLGDTPVARYGHDYRGGEHWIRFADGLREECALGAIWDFAPTDDAHRRQLTREAADWLRSRLAGSR